MYLGIEGGGTTWVVVLASNSTTFEKREDFPTTDNPKETLESIRKWFEPYLSDIKGIGVATFGPIDANPLSKTYGYITATPKPGWKNTDVLGLLKLRNTEDCNNIPVRFDTDVNAPALAEYEFIRSKGNNDHITSCAYITVGTGVGVGLVVNKESIKGLMHPEAGHLRCPRLDVNDNFEGVCPYHGSCVEGLVGTRALCARFGVSAKELKDLPDDLGHWNYVAYQLANLCVNLILIASPQKISIGGGVMNRKCLYPLIRKHTFDLLNSYIVNENVTKEGLETYISPSEFGSTAGITGAVYLAIIAASQ